MLPYVQDRRYQLRLHVCMQLCVKCSGHTIYCNLIAQKAFIRRFTHLFFGGAKFCTNAFKLYIQKGIMLTHVIHIRIPFFFTLLKELLT